MNKKSKIDFILPLIFSIFLIGCFIVIRYLDVSVETKRNISIIVLSVVTIVVIIYSRITRKKEEKDIKQKNEEAKLDFIQSLEENRNKATCLNLFLELATNIDLELEALMKSKDLFIDFDYSEDNEYYITICSIKYNKKKHFTCILNYEEERCLYYPNNKKDKENIDVTEYKNSDILEMIKEDIRKYEL